MTDFTKIIENNLSYRAYGGKNSLKKWILLNNENYMLKIERKSTNPNHILSEYIASKIYSMFLPTQEVILGKIKYNNGDKLCVACKDFQKEREYLYEFVMMKNYIGNGFSTELEEILTAIEKQKFYKTEEVRKRFWDMFILDSYLGNSNRNNENWGFIVNEKSKKISLAPIYSCSSCLYPVLNDEEIKYLLTDKKEFEKRILISTDSAIKIENQKLNYYKFLTNTSDEDCLKSIREIVPKINEKTRVIEEFINNLEVLSDIRKEFYCKVLNVRKEKILERTLERAKIVR